MLITINLNSEGQTLGMSAGLNRNIYYVFHSNYEGWPKNSAGSGYTFFIDLNEVNFLDTLPLRFTVRYGQYTGTINTHFNSLAGSSTTYAEIEKYNLGAAIYPMNFKIGNKVNLSFGCDFNYTLNGSMNGYHNSYVMNYWYRTTELDPDKYFSKFNVGVIFLADYSFKLNEKFNLYFQYTFYLGLTDEFRNIEQDVKSMQHQIGIGISKNLKI